MIGVNITIDANLLKAIGPQSEPVKDAKFRNFQHAAASIRKNARSSIKSAPPETRTRARRRRGQIVARARSGASRPGTPPYTRRGALRRAILWDVNEQSAIIGPRQTVVGLSAAAHEFGETYKGTDYPERPFMQPALEQALPRFADSWAGSIGE